MNLKHEFETETGQGIGYLEGKEAPEDNGTYNDAYVEWLEKKLVNLFDIQNVSKCFQCGHKEGELTLLCNDCIT